MSTTYPVGNETKHKILTQSKLLFHQKGYAATTYTDISTSANVNRALIPYHFQSKPILGKAVFQEILTQTHMKLDTILDMSQFSADFAGMLHLMSFYYLLQDNIFATFCTQVLADDHTILFNFETEQAELLSLSKKLSSISSEELHILTLMHIGIKEQMIQYLMFHPEMNVSAIAKMHLALLLSYIGQSRKKCDELIDAACEVLDMLSFQIDDSFTVSISFS